ncbi:MAG: transposase [Candidatus Korarchaeota archaeon NZ13-K]|nr:MAG: transposase [Candidatus Korarchaeota archaeon NZ13-K]
MVRFCLERAIKLGVTSRKRLHEAVYRELREKYPSYPSHYVYTAITQALAMFKSYRRLSRRGKNVSPPEIKNLNTVLLDDAHLFWFSWGSLKLATHRGHVVVPFEVHEHSRKFIGWQVKGARLVRRGGSFFLHVTFRKAVEEREPEGVLGIDVNERSIDLIVVKPDKVKFVRIDISEAKCVRDRYFRKRRNIQKKTSGETKARLLAKYSRREKQRVNDILHRASKIIARIVAEENVKPVMERLTDMREKIRYGRKMNRRLHSMPFRKIQLYISYKSMEQGFNPEFVDAKNTSRTCPICGELNKPNGHVFKCKECGFQADRHFVAAWNIAAKLPMCRPLPLAAKATEAFEAEVERIVIEC